MASGEASASPLGAGLSSESVAERLATVRRRIEAGGGDPAAVRVVAVTKGFGPEAVAAAVAAGLPDVGENYAQELVAKAAALPVATADKVRWHYLGAVQRNKVRPLAPLVACWQGVARSAEGREIARRRPGAEVLVEVDASGSSARTGCRPEEAIGLVHELLSFDLDVRGLMTVAPRDRSRARATFRMLRELADRLELPERSMGMSDDLEEAVAEGSTMVRVGRALFGERPLRAGRAGRGGRRPQGPSGETS